MQFEFATANRIIFGSGKVQLLPQLVSEIGRNPFFVIGKSSERVQPILSACKKSGLSMTSFQINGEPTVAVVSEGTEIARQSGCDCVIGIGGGSVLDAAKAIASMISNPGDPLDYLEVIGQGKKLPERPVSLIAVPTTAGTGTEVTRNAVLKSEEHHVKVSMRDAAMIPDIALIDPVLTYSMSPEVTASTGLDALTQVIEPFVSNQSNPVTDGICKEGIGLASQSLLKAYQKGNDEEAREKMCLVSLFGGLALANAKLGAVHGIAGPLGGLFDAPHGVICARLLPHVFELNTRLLQEMDPQSTLLTRFNEVSRLLTGDSNATAKDGAAWLHGISDKLHVPGLSHLDMTENDIRLLAVNSLNASSMKGNPVLLSLNQVNELIRKAVSK